MSNRILCKRKENENGRGADSSTMAKWRHAAAVDATQTHQKQASEEIQYVWRPNHQPVRNQRKSRLKQTQKSFVDLTDFALHQTATATIKSFRPR